MNFGIIDFQNTSSNLFLLTEKLKIKSDQIVQNSRKTEKRNPGIPKDLVKFLDIKSRYLLPGIIPPPVVFFRSYSIQIF